jgi:hypothetical protein
MSVCPMNDGAKVKCRQSLLMIFYKPDISTSYLCGTCALVHAHFAADDAVGASSP